MPPSELRDATAKDARCHRPSSKKPARAQTPGQQANSGQKAMHYFDSHSHERQTNGYANIDIRVF
jgi:hypothetical protein